MAKKVQKSQVLTAPFPWYGGKRRWAEDVATRFGELKVYVEPFAGSLAVLLATPPRPRELVCDLDGVVCNFWRAVRQYPEEVAYHADYPTYNHDLTARRRWMAQWRDDHVELLSEDPDYCDAKMAGWWAWGVSNWIRGAGEFTRTWRYQASYVLWTWGSGSTGQSDVGALGG